MNETQKEEFDSFDDFEQREIKMAIKIIGKKIPESKSFKTAVVFYANGAEGDYSQLSVGMLKAYRKYGKFKKGELKELDAWIRTKERLA